MTVLHYAGHMIGTRDKPGRFPPRNEKRVRREVAKFIKRRKISIGFGSLASGADILIAEELLRKGRNVEIFLPFAEESFLNTSVRPAGGIWEERFRAVKPRATSWHVMNSGPYNNEPRVFSDCTRLAMKEAISFAQSLGEKPEQLVIWDGVETGGVAGTAHDIALWRQYGFNSTIIPSN